MQCVPLDQRSHRVEQGKAYEFHAMLPPEHGLEQVAQPVDDFALASAGEAVDECMHGLGVYFVHLVEVQLFFLQQHALVDCV